MRTLCPHCGFDLAQDEVIERGDIRFDPRGDVIWHGAPLRMTQCERILLGTLLKDRGRILPWEAVADRMDVVSRESVQVHLCRLRRVLTARGEPDPIETVLGLGIRWAA